VTRATLFAFSSIVFPLCCSYLRAPVHEHLLDGVCTHEATAR